MKSRHTAYPPPGVSPLIHPKIVKWNQGPGAPANVWFAKQNLPPIIYEGKLNPNLSR